MFTSEKNKKATLRTFFIYVGITVLTILFGAIYEANSRGVYSADMAHAWGWVMGFGVGMYALLAFLPIKKVPGTLISSIYNFGVGLITARSIFIGVVDIYGTPRPEMAMVYLIISLVFLIPGFVAYTVLIVLGLLKKNEPENKNIE